MIRNIVGDILTMQATVPGTCAEKEPYFPETTTKFLKYQLEYILSGIIKNLNVETQLQKYQLEYILRYLLYYYSLVFTNYN